MAFGKMNTKIQILSTEQVKDKDGFTVDVETVLASIHAYKEVRNTSARWERIIGNAAFSGVNALFRFRKVPELTVATSHFITDLEGRYNIVSSEDVRGRNMYVEVLAEKIEGSKI